MSEKRSWEGGKIKERKYWRLVWKVCWRCQKMCSIRNSPELSNSTNRRRQAMAERAGLILIKCLFKSNVFENYNWFPPAMPLTKPLSQRSLKSSQLTKNPSWQPFFPEKRSLPKSSKARIWHSFLLRKVNSASWSPARKHDVLQLAASMVAACPDPWAAVIDLAAHLPAQPLILQLMSPARVNGARFH